MADQPNTEKVYPINALAFHPKYAHGFFRFRTFASAGGDGMINIWDMDAKKRIRQLPRLRASVTSVAFSSSGDEICASASDYSFKT